MPDKFPAKNSGQATKNLPPQPRPFYAHSLKGRPAEEWQPLEEHLENVAEMAAEFAAPFRGNSQ